ncbi:UNVERIFIED_CONTAM: hypothetical protein GTU68_039734 [Idotea baltica]|nr:hypothetical protein [Idotea baltica]
MSLSQQASSTQMYLVPEDFVSIF